MLLGICERALAKAKEIRTAAYMIVDTAGRLHIDLKSYARIKRC